MGKPCGFKSSGPGIPAEDLDWIFDKFYRVQVANRRRVGIGLGLAICRGFFEAMGAIKAGNPSDRSGAVFTITLPVPAARATAKDIDT
jgi:two-component system, OmpR family, sensor histidine kinase KdpD